jgi:uncharacterized membrane protein YcfT
MSREESDMAPSTRLGWVDVGRGLAISLVVFFHARNWLAATGIDLSFWEDFNTILSSLRMPMFFALSGLFAGKWLLASWGSLIRTKVVLFAWVLVVWSAIGICVQLTGLYVAGEPVSLTTAAKDLLFTLVSPLYELWFVWALALFFVLVKLTQKIPVWLQLAVAGIISAVALTLWLNTTTGLTGSAKFYFFFLCGLYLRQGILMFSASAAWLRALTIVVWFAVSLTLFLLDLRGVPVAYFVNCVLGVVAGVALSTFLIRVSLLQHLGRQTLPIYLAHTPIVILVSIAIMLAPPLLVVAEFLGPLLLPVVAALAIAAALGLHRLCAPTPFRYLYEAPPAAVRVFGRR